MSQIFTVSAMQSFYQINIFQLHPNNKTEVGRLAQELYQTKDATLITVPSVDDTVLYLLEIGFLKVQRDLQFIALSESCQFFLPCNG